MCPSGPGADTPCLEGGHSCLTSRVGTVTVVRCCASSRRASAPCTAFLTRMPSWKSIWRDTTFKTSLSPWARNPGQEIVCAQETSTCDCAACDYGHTYYVASIRGALPVLRARRRIARDRRELARSRHERGALALSLQRPRHSPALPAPARSSSQVRLRTTGNASTAKNGSESVGASLSAFRGLIDLPHRAHERSRRAE